MNKTGIHKWVLITDTLYFVSMCFTSSIVWTFLSLRIKPAKKDGTEESVELNIFPQNCLDKCDKKLIYKPNVWILNWKVDKNKG